MNSARYAVYYAPSEDHPLTKKAADWLGRCAWQNIPIERSLLTDINDDLDALTAAPRHYGFHATLKAPFALAEDRTEAELLEAVEAFCVGYQAFDVQMSVSGIGGFLALMLSEPSDAMTDLHTHAVKDFDGFRAPMTDADITRRRRAPLSPEQDARMLEWGYPYIFDEFRFHMTLSSFIKDETKREMLRERLDEAFEPQTHRVDGLAVFYQPNRESDFVIRDRFSFRS